MKNLISLLKIYALNNLGLNKTIHSKNKSGKGKLVATSLLFAFVLVMMLFSISIYAVLFGSVFAANGCAYLMPSFFMVIASLMILITNIFSVRGILFAFTDYDLQMALPLSEKTIVLSRMIILYLTNLMFSVLIMTPAMIVYGFFVQTDFMFYLTYIIGIFLTPAIPILIGSLLGLIITVATAKMKIKNFAKTILQILFFALIMVFSFSIGNLTSSDAINTTLIGPLTGLMTTISNIYPVVGLFNKGVFFGEWLQFTYLILINIICFAVFVYFTGKVFKKINSLMNASTARGDFKSNYISKDMKINSPLKALTIKEFRRYFSSSVYVINTLIGMIMLVLATGFFLFNVQGALVDELMNSEIKQLISSVIPVALCFFIFLGTTTPYSISMEGKSFGITRSLPVKASLIFKSKLIVNIIINLPVTIICGMIICAKLGVEPIYYIFSIILPVLATIFAGVLGLILNLNFPKMEWQSEAAVVKQSAAGFISVFGGMIFGVVFAIGTVSLSSIMLPAFILIIISVIMAGVSWGAWYYINTKGDKLILKL